MAGTLSTKTWSRLTKKAKETIWFKKTVSLFPMVGLLAVNGIRLAHTQATMRNFFIVVGYYFLYAKI